MASVSLCMALAWSHTAGTTARCLSSVEEPVPAVTPCVACPLCFQYQGKSLSLICGALSWLQDFEKKKQQEEARLLAPEGSGQEEKQTLASGGPACPNSRDASGEPDWVTAFVQKKEEQDLVHRLKVEKSSCVDKGENSKV